MSDVLAGSVGVLGTGLVAGRVCSKYGRLETLNLMFRINEARALPFLSKKCTWHSLVLSNTQHLRYSPQKSRGRESLSVRRLLSVVEKLNRDDAWIRVFKLPVRPQFVQPLPACLQHMNSYVTK
jgi:hypothetical protein